MINIYIIKNTINKKVYIGATRQPIEDRFNEHCANSRSKHKASRNKLYKAMSELGEEHFFIELIESVDDSIAQMREQYWIDYYISINKGYNRLRSYYISTQNHKTKQERLASKEYQLEKEITFYIIEHRPSFDEVLDVFEIDSGRLHSLIRGKGMYTNNLIKYPIIKVKTCRKNLTTQQLDTIVSYIKCGKSFTDIANEYGISVTEVSAINKGYYYYKQQESYPIRKTYYHKTKRMSDDNCELIISKLKENYLYDEIAKLIDNKLTRGHISTIDKGKATFFDYDKFYPSKDFPIRKNPPRKHHN